MPRPVGHRVGGRHHGHSHGSHRRGRLAEEDEGGQHGSSGGGGLLRWGPCLACLCVSLTSVYGFLTLQLLSASARLDPAGGGAAKPSPQLLVPQPTIRGAAAVQVSQQPAADGGSQVQKVPELAATSAPSPASIAQSASNSQASPAAMAVAAPPPVFMPEESAEEPPPVQRGPQPPGHVLCGRCRAARPDGFPTTAVAQKRATCTWTRYDDTFLGQYADGTGTQMTLEQAKESCERFERGCKGVTCNGQSLKQNPNGPFCSVRAGDARGFGRSSDGEVTFGKACKLEPVSADCDKPSFPPAPSASATGTEHVSSGRHRLPVVILAHSRSEQLSRVLNSLANQPDAGLLEVAVSLDSPDHVAAMEAAIAQSRFPDALVWRHPAFDSLSVQESVANFDRLKIYFTSPTALIARHYWLAFDLAFQRWEFALFLEEDLVAAPDLVAMFRSTLPLLRADPSLRCVSAWNDYGFSSTARDDCRLFRTSWFPGLGFLISNATWQAVRPHWPHPHGSAAMGWDYWMRMRFLEGGWECIVPEVPRVRHLGAGGSSVSSEMQTQIFDKMTLSSGSVLRDAECPADGPLEHCWAFGDLDYLRRGPYEARMEKLIREAKVPSQYDTSVKAFVEQPHQPNTIYLATFFRNEWSTGSPPVGSLFFPELHTSRTSSLPDVRMDRFGLLMVVHVATQTPVLLVDKRSTFVRERFESILPVGLMQQAHSKTQHLASSRPGVSCEMVCGEAGLRCDVEQMGLLGQDCRRLREFFPCERGCQFAVGEEMPVYVSAPGQEPTDQQCLVHAFSSLPNCAASHQSTRRLCACLPK